MLQIRNSFKILAPSGSLRRRVAYSLAIVRLILVPVIFLAVYYLFKMGSIVDRIVNVDAPAATMVEQVSIEMLQARRAERNYLLLRDPSYLEENRESVTKIRETLGQIQNLQPEEQPLTRKALDELSRYEKGLTAAAPKLGPPSQATTDRLQAVVHAYERDLNNVLIEAKSKTRARLVDELRSQVGSFDAEISKTVQEGAPALSEVTSDLQNSSQEILQLMPQLEARNGMRLQSDHRAARHLISDAEWSLGVVSSLTFLLSVWISFILPRQVVKPLLSLKDAVDRAAAGDYAIDFEIQGRGEVVELARSVRNLVERMRPRDDSQG